MKKIGILLPIGVLMVSLMFAELTFAQDSKNITHVVLVWLKSPGDAQQRADFIKASEQLNDLPGIIHRHTGVVLPSERGIVDDTFDVAVTVTLKDQAALQAYLDNPKHKHILHDKIKPLINRVVAYDFISQ